MNQEPVYGVAYENYLILRAMPTTTKEEYEYFVGCWKRAVSEWESHQRAIKRTTRGLQGVSRYWMNDLRPLLLLMYELRRKRKKEAGEISEVIPILEKVSKKYFNALRMLGNE